LNAFQGESSTPSALDELLRRYDRGDFDLVAVGRALLADAGWAQKAHQGRSGELGGFNKEALATLSQSLTGETAMSAWSSIAALPTTMGATDHGGKSFTD
jgi:2,4-dienoyl-CoA reductase-like NADH-dependent reductase (Old Yellow Enzyme family)